MWVLRKLSVTKHLSHSPPYSCFLFIFSLCVCVRASIRSDWLDMFWLWVRLNNSSFPSVFPTLFVFFNLICVSCPQCDTQAHAHCGFYHRAALFDVSENVECSLQLNRGRGDDSILCHVVCRQGRKSHSLWLYHWVTRHLRMRLDDTQRMTHFWELELETETGN